MSVTSNYVDQVVHRAQQPMQPLGFEPAWEDKPRRHKVYPDTVRIPLPVQPPAAKSVDAALYTVSPSDGRFTLGALSGLLRDSYGLIRRRLALSANADGTLLPANRNAVWSRGAASGGGLYPVEIYWVCGPRGPLTPGIYHYSSPHHELHRLLAADVTGHVRDALTDDDGETDQFLLATVKLWKNSFKYSSFAYHVVTMDLGTLLGTWQLWTRGHGLIIRPQLWFDESALNRLLGISTDAESVFAVVPVPWDTEQRTPIPSVAHPGTAVIRAEDEYSRTVVRFPQVEAVHREIVAAVKRPAVPTLEDLAPRRARPNTKPVALPAPAGLPMSVSAALRLRRSSFGRFIESPPLSARQLATVLSAGSTGGRLVSDVKRADGTPSLTRLAVFCNHVDGMRPGVYEYDDARHQLLPLRAVDALFLQRSYFLNNYNLEQAAVVLSVMARPKSLIDAIGPRGYRVLNAEVGAVAQSVYVACAAMDLGCGAVLGFDNAAYVEHLGLAGSDTWPLLLIMIGSDRRPDADLEHRIV